MKIRIWHMAVVLMVLLSITACSAPVATVSPTSAPATSAPATSVPATSAPKAVAPTPTTASIATATPAPKVSSPTAVPAQPTAATKSTQATTNKLDIDKLLPNAPGRELMLEYCVGCHHIAAIAIAAKPKEEWLSHKQGHMGRTVMSQAIYDKIYDYLIANFPPDRKIPELPPELLSDWTSY